MSTTPTDTLEREEQVKAGVAAHALISLGLHLSRHVATIAAPLGFDLPGAGHEPTDRLLVHVPHYAADAWAATINVQADHECTPADDRDPYLERRIDGLLPDSGLRVQLYALYPVLAAVVSA